MALAASSTSRNDIYITEEVKNHVVPTGDTRPSRSIIASKESKLNTKIKDHHSALEWSTLDLLDIGDHYVTSTTSPISYLEADRARGRGNRLEIDAIMLIGPGSKPVKRTYWHKDQEVLIIPPEHVGQRLTDAAVAFAQRDRLGSDFIELSDRSWPNCLPEDDVEDVTVDDAEHVVYVDEQEV